MGGGVNGWEVESMAGRRSQWMGGGVNGWEAESMTGRRSQWLGGGVNGWEAESMAQILEYDREQKETNFLKAYTKAS